MAGRLKKFHKDGEAMSGNLRFALRSYTMSEMNIYKRRDHYKQKRYLYEIKTAEVPGETTLPEVPNNLRVNSSGSFDHNGGTAHLHS